MNRRPLRVLQVIYRADRAGIETWLVHLLRQIDRSDMTMDFVVHDKLQGAYDAEIQDLGSRIFICDGYRNPWRQFWRLRDVIRRHGPYDVVHSHVDYFSGVIVCLARLLGVPTRIANCHNDAPDAERGTTFVRRLYLRAMQFLVRRFATAGLATSRVAAAALFGPDWNSDSRWRIHSACVDLRFFHRSIDRLGVRAELGIPADAVVFGHVGRFVEQKNHKFILRVAEILAGKADRARFFLVGSGPGQRQIENLIHDRGLTERFVILPPRDDIPRLMLGAFDFFLFPSRWEGLGLALVEAQAAGLRCFASTAVPPEAVVIPSLVHQLPLLAGPETWAHAILERIDTASPMNREEALRKAEERFDIRKNAAQLLAFYQAVAS